MISILNSIGVHFAVFGNHEFDFGVDLLQDVVQEMQCQWFLSNVFDTFTSQPLGHGLVQKILEWNKLKIGLMGLVEEDWLSTLGTVDKANLQYIDYVAVANQLAVDLRAQGAEFVIAMTHMKWDNDFRLAQNCQGVDLVLGGHDHEYGVKKVKNTWIVKSGSDFKNLTEIKIKNNSGSLEYEFQKIDIMQTLHEDEFVKAIVQESTLNLQYMLKEVLCTTDTDLDGRFITVRRAESNLGNLITNAMLEATHADVALLNSGTLRSDRVHPAGNFTLHDLMSILPLVDPVLVVKIRGDVLLKALENGVCQFPALDGRYLQVAGIEFGFYPKAEPGCRIVEGSVKVQGEDIDKNKSYLIAIKEYLAHGRDGYSMFPSCPRMFNVETAQILSTIVINHFESVKIAQGMKKCISGHRMSLITVSQHASVTAFEKKTVDNLPITAVPDVEGRIYHVSEEMKASLQDLRAAKEEGLSTISNLFKKEEISSVAGGGTMTSLQ
ncbi:mannosylglucosyl-3-phosphoglycerate phosphatase-like isoform X1 [Lissotriton helveticus]